MNGHDDLRCEGEDDYDDGYDCDCGDCCYAVCDGCDRDDDGDDCDGGGDGCGCDVLSSSISNDDDTRH